MTPVLLSLLVAAPASAHPDKDAPRTLINGHGIGGYGAPVFGIAMVDGQPAMRFGGRGGWVTNRSIGVGAFGESLTTMPSAAEDVQIRVGGLFVEAHVAARAPVHATFEAGLGLGNVQWGDRAAFGLAPFAAARLELNLVTWMRASIGPTAQFLVADSIPAGSSPLTYGGDLVFKFGAF